MLFYRTRVIVFYEYPFHYLLLLYKLSLRIDLVRWAKKWSEVGVENFSVWVPTYFVGASLKVFSLRTTNFLSEAGAVLTFFAYFFVLRQKSKWGFRGKAPVVLKSKALGNLSDNHNFYNNKKWINYRLENWSLTESSSRLVIFCLSRYGFIVAIVFLCNFSSSIISDYRK